MSIVALHYQNEVRIRLVLISDGSEPRLGLELDPGPSIFLGLGLDFLRRA